MSTELGVFDRLEDAIAKAIAESREIPNMPIYLIEGRNNNFFVDSSSFTKSGEFILAVYLNGAKQHTGGEWFAYVGSAGIKKVWVPGKIA